MFLNPTLKKALHLLIVPCAALLPAWSFAQVSLYEYSSAVNTYTEITVADGGYSLGTPTPIGQAPLHQLRAFVDPNNLDGQVTDGGYLNPARGPGFPIGFDFNYNGDVFDRIGVAHGGWISFGKSSDGPQAVVTFTSDHSAGRPLSHSYWHTPLAHAYQRNRIAGWGSSALRMQDMSALVPPGPVSSLRVATVGTAPNRVCVIQWKDFRHNYSVDNYRINFQIRLNESDNSVEVRFGPMEWGWQEASAQIGLGGSTNEDFNNRVVVYGEPAFLYDWNYTVAGTVNTASMIATQPQPGQPNGSGVVPAVGRTFKWTPDACAPPAWPVELVSTGLGFFELEWPDAPGAVSYDYVVTTQPDPTSTAVSDGSVNDSYALIQGLDTLVSYYVYVRSICDDGIGPWGLPTMIRSVGGAVLECGVQPLEQYHCYAPAQSTTWHYSTSDGFSPIRVDFTGGAFTVGSSFRVFDGPDTNATVLWNSTTGGVLPGRTFVTTGPTLTLKMIGHETAGCTNTEGSLHAIEWRLGCKDCVDPLVSYLLGDVDCAAEEFYVDANVFSLGTATELVIENDLGVAPLTVTSGGLYSVGPFPAGEPVTIITSNSANALCAVVSAPQVNEPCPLLDCGPTWYEACLDQGDVRTWLFVGDDDQVAVRFLPTYQGVDTRIRSYNGASESSPPLAVIEGSTNNQIRRSDNDGNELLVQYAASIFNEYSCTLGNTPPLEFVVGCTDGCQEPTATFAYADCTVPSTFNIVVNVTSLGSAASVLITNDGGAPEVTASATGQYTVGPFTSGSAVRVHVEGANEICTWSSGPMTRSCLDVGVVEHGIEPIRIFPNPNNGNFRIALPAVFNSRTELLIVDLSGRVVGQQVLIGGNEVAMDLAHLPAGLYTLLAQGDVQRATAKISIQH